MKRKPKVHTPWSFPNGAWPYVACGRLQYGLRVTRGTWRGVPVEDRCRNCLRVEAVRKVWE